MFSGSDLDSLLDALRDGDEYRTSSSGGRYATRCFWKDGVFFVEEFNEGTTFEHRYDTDEMRAFIARSEDDVWLRLLVDYRARRARGGGVRPGDPESD